MWIRYLQEYWDEHSKELMSRLQTKLDDTIEKQKSSMESYITDKIKVCVPVVSLIVLLEGREAFVVGCQNIQLHCTALFYKYIDFINFQFIFDITLARRMEILQLQFYQEWLLLTVKIRPDMDSPHPKTP